MKKRPLYFLLPIFALTGLLFAPQNTFALPPDTNPDTTVVTDPEEPNNIDLDNSESDNGNTFNASCYDHVGGIGWLVCPVTGTLAKAIDSVYGIIEGLLEVNPISTDQNSPIYMVWEYIRNITNIVFIIFLLVVIYAQLTEFGITNYGIKKVLPRVIVAAFLVNLSYIICALAVDVSNILGSSLGSVFTNIYEVATSTSETVRYSISDITGTILGTAAVGGVAAGATIATLAITGGIGAALWMLLPVIFAGIIAVVTAFITMAARQALIIILIMIAPLAIVAYLLPNTEKWFKKWKDLFFQMLIFYPMFAVLFGASQLASWVIIDSSNNIFGIILGIAVQILPLFFALSLMKMSKTLLGSIGTGIQKLTSPAQKGIGAWAGSRAAARKAEHLRKGLSSRRFNPIRSSSWAALMANNKARLANRTQTAEEDSKALTSERLNARKLGKRIIGYNRDGKPIYSSKPIRATKEMKLEFAHREIKLRTDNVANDLDSNMSTMSSYLENNNIETGKGLAAQIKALTTRQAQNFQDSDAIKRAAARNALADKRFLYESILAAQEDPTSEDYQRLIIRGAGADGLSDNDKIRADARRGVIAEAYDMMEAERKGVIGRYTTYLDKNVTLNVKNVHEQMLKDKNIDGIVAAQNVLAKRGDYDEIQDKLSQYMDQDGWLEIGSDEANVLASNLLSMDGDPSLKRLGKHINMETWRYTSDPTSRSKYVTMKEYFTGFDQDGTRTKTGGIIELMRGTNIEKMDRSAFGQLIDQAGKYYFGSPGDPGYNPNDPRYSQLVESMMPALISGIPKMDTDGDQIVNALHFITGIKKNREHVKGRAIQPDRSLPNYNPPLFEGTPNQANIFTMLSGLTPHDLIAFKTNEVEIMEHALSQICGSNADGARLYREIHAQAYGTTFDFTTTSGRVIPNIKGTGNIDRINAMDKSATTIMRGRNKQLLGIQDSP